MARAVDVLAWDKLQNSSMCRRALIQWDVVAKTRSRQRAATADSSRVDQGGAAISEPEVIPAAELLSCLKELRAFQPWTENDLAKTLRVGLPKAKEAIAILQLQGYVEPTGSTSKWRVTEEGEIVSGAKHPRFTRKSVEDALTSVRDRIKDVNKDADSPYRVTEAVAFGDFLREAARVQAADVGIRLVSNGDSASAASAKERAAELEFLKKIRGKSSLLHVVPYEDWMGSRSHLRLL
jgi:hypothetical protein